MRLVSSLSCPLSTRIHSVTPSSLDALFCLVEDWRNILIEGLPQHHKISPQDLLVLNIHLNAVVIRLLWIKLCEDKGTFRPQIIFQWSQFCLGYTQFNFLFREALWPIIENDQDRPSSDHSIYKIGNIDPKNFQSVLQKIDTVNLRLLIGKQEGPPGMASGLILGHVYGYLLGHPIGKQGQGRKLNGGYYTPLDVVEWMVDRTLEPRLERLLLDETTILDPSCGGGVFLTVIYQRLLNWYAERSSDQWLTIENKKNILGRHIYGVDLDPLAVEVTRLSLLLVLTDNSFLNNLEIQELGGQKNHETLEGGHDSFSDEKNWNLMEPVSGLLTQLLPGINRNIQWGNTLVGDDIFNDISLSQEQCDRICPFTWQTAFPQIFTPEQQSAQPSEPYSDIAPENPRNGFDIVIGNPPYIDAESMSRYQPEERQYCATHYETASGNWDIFCVFCEKALQLCRTGGLSSFIVPNKLASADYAKAIRQFLAVDHQLLYLRDYSAVSVFPISVYPLAYVVRKKDNSWSKSQLKQSQVQWERVVSAVGVDQEIELKQRSLSYIHFSDPQRPWAIASTASLQSLITHIRHQGTPLGQVAAIAGAATVSEAYRLKPFIQEVSISKRKRHTKPTKTDDPYFKFVNSGTIDPYCFLWGQKPLQYLKQRFQAPVISFHQEPQLTPKRWQQAQAAKIVVAGMTLRLECALDWAGEFFPGKSTTVIRLNAEAVLYDLRYLLAILNSTLMSVYYRTEFGGNALNGGYLRIGPPQIKQLPIYRGSQMQQAQLIDLVDALHMAQRSGQQREREAIARQIDQQVYALYNLSTDDIELLDRQGNCE